MQLFFWLLPTLVFASPELPIANPKMKCPRLDVFAALQTRQVKCIDEALKNMDVNSADLDGNTPLHAAILARDKNAVLLFLKRGANLVLRNDLNQTPREMAEALRYERVARFFAKRELETERLMAAVEQGDVVQANASLLRGASIGTTNVRGDTPLHRAVQSDFPELALLLIRAGANVNARNYLGETPLHAAAMRDFSASARVLLQQGANPSALNHRRESPLDLAGGQVSALLVKYKARPGSPFRQELEFVNLEGAPALPN
jgi:ankyrin repeat protein